MAEQQQGFFTAKQAKSAGFAENTHPYDGQAGNWIREHRGISRYGDLPAADVAERQGFQLTRPLRTIIDLIEAGTVDRHLIRQSIKQALERGLITRQQVRQRDMSDAVCKFFEDGKRRLA
jgi:hypothetical protein